MNSEENRPDFGLLLTDGAIWSDGSTRITMSRQNSPKLVLPTGRLTASGFGHGDPFVETVPPGAYSTAIFSRNIAQLEDDGSTVEWDFEGEPVLQINILDSPVATWEPAMVADADPEYHNKYNTFAVDGGIGIFCDAALAETFLAMKDPMEPFQHTEASSLLAGVVDANTGANALCILYGGDGVHDSWIGRTPEGQVACFVIV